MSRALWPLLAGAALLAAACSAAGPDPGAFPGSAAAAAANPPSAPLGRDDVPEASAAGAPGQETATPGDEAWAAPPLAAEQAPAPGVDAPAPRAAPGALGPASTVTSGAWRLIAPDIGLDAPIVGTGLEPDGAMAAPTDPDVVGWYYYGAAPGGLGNALMGGHVDWTDRATGRPRGAVFWRLRQLNPGSRVIFTDGVQEYVYEVTEKRRYRWDDPAGVEVLQPTADSRLTLITCGGTFDRASRTYDMRDVVIAHRVA